MAPSPRATSSISQSEKGMISGMLLSSFLYISTKLKMQRSMCGASVAAMRSNVSMWRSMVYLRVSSTGS